jgi:metallo-beta-lactamase family protein
LIEVKVLLSNALTMADMKISFLGAAQEVTGSCFLIEAAGARFLIDCGMFQGRNASEKNFTGLEFAPETIDFVLLSHAHIDHCGLLPRLCARGFAGPIYATKATADLLSIMLADSAHIQQSEAAWRVRHPKFERRSQVQRRSHSEPLYNVIQVQDCVRQVRPIDYRSEFQPHPNVRCVFQDAGHILGSAIIEIWLGQRGAQEKLVFSGDLGQPGRPVVNDPAPIAQADVLLVESTYGNRQHRSFEDTVDELAEVVVDTIHRRKGNVIVPAFALGRTQELLFLLFDLTRQGRLADLHVFVDSPLANRATAITLQHAASLDTEAKAALQMQLAGQSKVPIHFGFTETVEDSIRLNQLRSGAIIIAASGMCDAGRIRHHLRHNLHRRECAILIAGFQAQGTLGRRLVDGAKQVELLGEEVPVRASIHTLGGLSAHADQAALFGWLHNFKRAPRQTYVVHGEEQTAQGFADAVRTNLGWNALAPPPGAVVTI